MVLASSDKDFKGKKTLLGTRAFNVSTISYVNSGYDFFVLNRDNGQPFVNASVQVWNRQYDYNTSKYTLVKGKLYKLE